MKGSRLYLSSVGTAMHRCSSRSLQLLVSSNESGMSEKQRLLKGSDFRWQVASLKSGERVNVHRSQEVDTNYVVWRWTRRNVVEQL